MNRLYVLLQLIVLPLAARGWDIAVATGNEVDLFSGDGKIMGRLNPIVGLQALEFDPVHQVLFVGDDSNSNYSIFTISLQRKEELAPLIKRADNDYVRDIAYDFKSETLYWTGARAIYWYKSTMRSREGDILHKLDNSEYPHGITIDSCRRYLYWTNSNHRNPTIERSLLDGSQREVIITEELFQPLGITVDESEGKIYWSDDKAGIYYNIKRASLDGSNIETIIHGTHNKPAYLTVQLNNIYWSDWTYNAVWKIPKEPARDVKATMIYEYDERVPMGIVAWSNGRKNCPAERIVTAVTEEIQNSNEGFMSDAPSESVVSESSVNATAANTGYCLNSGVVLTENRNGTTCRCPRGYDGERCEVSTCHNYCLNDGECEIDHNGLPTCVCPQGTSGLRCEQRACSSYCLNGAVCEVDRRGNPICKCEGHFSGTRCEISNTEHQCRGYCQQFGQVYVPIDRGDTPMCLCPSTIGSVHNELLPLENSSSPSINAVSSAELSQSCARDKTISDWVSAALGCACTVLMIATAILLRKVFVLRKRPRIKKRIIVSKNVTPLTSRPPLPPEQCEITIENCCNMNICETPCFEPQLRTPKSSRTEEKKTLLGNMEETPSSSPCQDELY